MSIQTTFHFRNENDPDYLKAKNGTEEEREAWEDENGCVVDRPGARIDDFLVDSWETEDEYGGLVINLRSVPKNATHLVITRS